MVCLMLSGKLLLISFVISFVIFCSRPSNAFIKHIYLVAYICIKRSKEIKFMRMVQTLSGNL